MSEVTTDLQQTQNEVQQNIKVSVIVPVYNAQKHLHQCMDSIVGQTLREIEIICVDDGSTDSSLQILKEYAAKDPRIQIYTQENLYAGTARNLGMTKAAGKYYVFWDSDDYFRLNALEKMYEKIEEDQADICVCGGDQYLEEVGKEFQVSRYADRTKLPEEIPFNRTTNEKYILNFTGEVPWNKMFLADFVKRKGLLFQKTRNGNDVYFVENALCMADKITVLLDHLVVYRKAQYSSLVGTLYKSPLSPFMAWIDTRENLEKEGILPEQSFVNRAMASVSYLMTNIRNWEAFCEAADFFKQEGCRRLGIIGHDREYFYNPWNYDLAEHLNQDEPHELLMFLNRHNYESLLSEMTETRILNQTLREERRQFEKELRSQKNEYEKQLRMLQNRFDDMKNSASFKIGRVITAPVRKIRGDRYREPASAHDRQTLEKT